MQKLKDAFQNARPALVYSILFISLVVFWVVAWVLTGDCSGSSEITDK